MRLNFEWLGWFKKSSFAPAFYLLEPKPRQALQTLYAVCRLLDDAVDHKDPQVREILSAWRQFFIEKDVKLVAPFGHEELASQFVLVLKVYDIPQFSLLDLIDKGVSVDLEKNRFETPMDTESYCYGVAGTVGVACLPLFGVPWQEAKEFAIRLGITVQWINTIRDVGVDAKMNRIYLPQDHLEKFGVKEADILKGEPTPEFIRLMQHEAEVARSHHRRALEMMPQKWEKELLPARMMANIYLKLLEKCEKQAYPVLEKSVRLNILEKILVPWRTLKN